MDIKKYLAGRKKLTDRRLKKYMSYYTKPKKLVGPIKYSVMAPGKRLRPILVMAAAEACGGDLELVIPTACAIELIHTFTLIHDDLPAIDDSDLRRGRPSCHKAYGEASAILAGDALLGLAFEGMLRFTNRRKVKDSILLKAIEEIVGAIGVDGVISGEVLDIDYEGRKVGIKRLLKMQMMKTASLIKVALRCGALLSGASPKKINALSRYGDHLGLSFQIMDDVLDVTGTSALLGKPVRLDAVKSKATYPGMAGVAKARELALREASRAIQSIKDFDHRAEPLRGIARFVVEREG